MEELDELLDILAKNGYNIKYSVSKLDTGKISNINISFDVAFDSKEIADEVLGRINEVIHKLQVAGVIAV